ncbi:MAG TPA: hypothetical protein VFP80_11595 [Thermoanaerobaculia bacterium]|nr:hypothetical protein [Thermoanaerobaculia bacterium]
MIYAAVPLPAFELTHPAIVIIDYLEDSIANKRFDELPKSAAWMIREFLQQALRRDDARVDPVASAVSYELAASTLEEVEDVRLTADEAVRKFDEFLARIEEKAPMILAQEDHATATELRHFLEKLRVRGQSASYARFGTCV